MFLDTSFCVDLLRDWRRGEEGCATRKLRELGDRRIFVSVFALCELHAGARVSRQPDRELLRLSRLTEFCTAVYPDSAFPALYAEIAVWLRRNGTPIPPMDLLIGATAKAHAMPLLAHDPGHFALIPGLVVETYR